MEITPIERKNNYFFKRDDYYQIAGVNGGKARTCWHLAQGAKGLVTAGSRQSPQVKIVAAIALYMMIPCHIHTPSGELTPVLQHAIGSCAKLFQHKPGYNSVIIKRAKDDAKKTGYTYIPFGMECWEAVGQTAKQVKDIPKEVKRIVVPVGSGMTMAGILNGLSNQGIKIPVLGIYVGANPVERILKYTPVIITRSYVDRTILFDYMLIKSDYDYHTYYPDPVFQGIELDPIYEAKCIPFLKEWDLLWIVGRR